MRNRKQLERRTFLQDRYDILFNKLKKGEASFAELTELDYIVNHSSMIRNKVLEEMQGIDNSSDDEIPKEMPLDLIARPINLADKLKQFFGKVFTLKFVNRCHLFHFKSATLAM